MAKHIGLRDAGTICRHYPLLSKIFSTPEERQILVDNKELGVNVNTKIITLSTARSAFLLLGHKVVKNGKPIEDDYYSEGVKFHNPKNVYKSDYLKPQVQPKGKLAKKIKPKNSEVTVDNMENNYLYELALAANKFNKECNSRCDNKKH